MQKGKPRLKQSYFLACMLLKNFIESYGNKLIEGSTGFWKYDKRPTVFCLCVDGFGVKYWSNEDVNYLKNATGKNFRHTVDMEGKNIVV